MKRNLLQENMRRFATKNIAEQDVKKSNFSLNVDAPFEKSVEIEAARDIAWQPAPVTCTLAEGMISDDAVDLYLQFSNGDELEYEAAGSSKTCRVYLGTRTVSVGDGIIERIMGSTGSVIGDLGLIYKDIKNQYS